MDKDALRVKWSKLYNEALESDTWGQVVEAVEGYTALLNQIKRATTTVSPTQEELNVLTKIALCLDVRAKLLRQSDTKGLSLPDMKKLPPVFEQLFRHTGEYSFPVDLGSYELTVLTDDVSGELGDKTPKHQGGSLLPAPQMKTGQTYLSFHMEKVGLKNASTFLDPFVTFSLVGPDGQCLESPQDTPISNRKKELYVMLDFDLHVQMPMGRFPEGTCLFFEFKHYKPKKSKVSTKGWSFMEMDEIKAGPIVLEIYKKPTDFRRKKINLLSIKPLYLHMILTMHKA